MHYFERPCSHGMAKKTCRHERIILCVCDQQVSLGQIMFSPRPTKFFPYADGCVIAVTYLVLLPVSWKSDVILVRIRRTVSSQDSNSCLPMSTFTSGASNATTTLYHCTRERSGVSLRSPGYLYYIREKL